MLGCFSAMLNPRPMDVVMFDGYAGPGWVWPIGRKSYNATYRA